jgi:hypothetical protein
MESNLVHLSTTAKQILDHYLDINEAYKRDKNFKKSTSTKDTFTWAAYGSRPSPTRPWSVPQRRPSPPPAGMVHNVDGPTAPTPPATPKNMMHHAAVTDHETRAQMELVEQVSNQDLSLQIKFEQWFDYNRNRHFPVLVHVPPGCDTLNTDARIHSGGQCLASTWNCPDIFENRNFLTSYLQNYYGTDPNNFPYKIDALCKGCHFKTLNGMGGMPVSPSLLLVFQSCFVIIIYSFF